MSKFSYMLIIIYFLCHQASATTNKGNCLKNSCLIAKNSASNMSNLVFEKYVKNIDFPLMTLVKDEGLILPKYLTNKLEKERISNTEMAFAEVAGVKFEVVNIAFSQGIYDKSLDYFKLSKVNEPCSQSVFDCFRYSLTTPLNTLNCNNTSPNAVMAQNIKSNMGITAKEHVYAYDFSGVIALVKKAKGKTVRLTLFSKNENDPRENTWMVFINASSHTALDNIVEALHRANTVEGQLFQ